MKKIAGCPERTAHALKLYANGAHGAPYLMGERLCHMQRAN